MDILIKSFNRPYYLDRCIQSIYLNCKGYDFSIKVLDDGTPQQYLNKLLDKYPEIKIFKSEFYAEKSVACNLGQKPEVMTIPIDFWVKSAKNASDYFVLLEDDIWINQLVFFDKMIADCQKDKVSFVKLFWLGNSKLIQTKTQISKENYVFYEPNLFTENPFLYNFIFYKFHRFGIRKTLKFLKIHTYDRFLAYYSIYAVAGVIFKKDYFLSLWKNHNSKVDEGLQLYNAVKYYYKNASTIAFAHSKAEILKTGFLSSATSQKKVSDKVQIDMFELNKILNEAWFNNSFDVMKNYPNDLDENQMEQLLKQSSTNENLVSNWKKWVCSFKNQFQSFGCQID